MRIIKITSMSCSSCIIMNSILNKLKEKYNFEITNYDYDFDDIEEYNVENILPVIIFYKNNKELKRLIGEKSLSEVEKIVMEVQNEKD